MVSTPKKPQPLKRAPTKAVAADEDGAGGAPSQPRDKKKAKKDAAAGATAGATTTTVTTALPTTASRPPGDGVLVQQGWLSLHDAGFPYIMYKRYGEPAYSGKIAAFDLDGTLLLQTADRPTGWAPEVDDWRYYNASVPRRLAELAADGYEIVVMSNQGTIRTAHTGKAAAKVCGRVDAALAALDPATPVTVIFATATSKDACPARKPGRGLWDFYTSSSVTRPVAAPPVDVASSFYAGDAAGRAVGENSANPAEPDFSDSDAAFAAAVGLDFKTPEEVFGDAERLDEYEARADAVGGNKGAGGGDSGAGPNARLVALFRRIADNSEGFRAVAVKKAAKVLEDLAEEASDMKHLKTLKGIGKSSLAWIQEFMDTGDIEEAHRGKPPPAPVQEGHGALAFA